MIQKENLKVLQAFVDEMKSTSSLNIKKTIINAYGKNPFIKSALVYTFDPYKKYYVTSKTCKKRSDLCDMNKIHDDIFHLLNDLNDRVYTGHDAIAMVNGFISQYSEYEDLIFSIIDRNMEIRASSSVINKVIPNLIPTFDVALATKYESKFCDFETEEWLASRKLDGVRCIIRKEGDKVNAYSRQGNEFTTLGKVLDDVDQMNGDFVLDGEICLMDENGNEDFQGIMKQIKRKDHIIENPKYIVFDYLTLEEFDSKKGERDLYSRLGDLLDEIPDRDYFETIEILDQTFISNEQELSDMITDADVNGYEGVMLRKNAGYEGKRSKNLLKCKKFFDAEYKVLDVDFDEHRVIREGKEVVMPMLAQAWIEHKGYRVAVGSGWNQEQRIRYQKDPDALIGKTITVQYFEETKNQEGGISLRFPTVKHVYENGRNV
jgi:DNA ligase-1